MFGRQREILPSPYPGCAARRGASGFAGSRSQSGRGFTLVEMVIAITVFTILIVLTAYAFIGPYRNLQLELAIVNLDLNGDKAFSQLSPFLRTAALPFRVDDGEKSEFAALYNDPARGFGLYGAEWRSILQRGSDCIPFSTPVDHDGDGDFIDADGLPELGVDVMNVTASAAAYSYVGVNRNNHLLGNIHPYLSSLNPADLGITTSDELNATASRFGRDFSFPANSHRAFGMVRFAPKYVDNAQVVMDEAVLNHDLNSDGDATDRFLLGHLEIVCPRALRLVDVGGGGDAWTDSGEVVQLPLTEDVVLLQINQGEKSWTPIFKLTKYRMNSASSNSISYDESNDTDGLYGIRIRLLLCDSTNKSFGNVMPVITRKYETLLNLRNMP